MLGFIRAGLQGPEQWGACSLASQALRKNEASNSDRRQSDVETKLPTNQPSSSADHPLLCAARGRGGMLGFPWLPSACAAPTAHLAACYPVCCRPRPSFWPPPGHPPKIEKERKLFPQAAAAQPEKLPSSEGAAGFLELETKSKPGPGAKVAPTAPSCLLRVSLPDSAEHVSCGCHAAGHRGAVGSAWRGPRLPSGPGRQGGSPGMGRARATAFLPLLPSWLWASAVAQTSCQAARHLAYEEQPLGTPWNKNPPAQRAFQSTVQGAVPRGQGGSSF